MLKRTALVVVLLAGCSVGVGDDDQSARSLDPAAMSRRSFTESGLDFANPERGFFVGVDLVAGGSTAAVKQSGLAIGFAEVRLDRFRDAPLDDAFLAALDAGLANVRATGVKVLLRFAYNADATSPDAPKSRILQHVAQLGPLLQRNADVIVAMEAGFIGAWGEWHSSQNGLDNDADRADILLALLDVLPASRMVQVRTPMFKDAIFPGGALGAAQAWNGSGAARVGHHDDCFLASDNDLGTYAGSTRAWKDYVAQDGQYTPVGGETCRLAAPRTDCPTALAELAANHWSFLNAAFNPEVLDGWRAQGCYDEIHRRLGYRFVMDGAAWTAAVPPGGQLDVTVDIRNDGFAAPFNARPVYLVISGPSQRWTVRLPEADPRRWRPGTATTVHARVQLPAAAPAGAYRLALWLPDEAGTLGDDPSFAVRFANQDTWDQASGENVLTRELRIDAAAPGPVDSTASQLVALQ